MSAQWPGEPTGEHKLAGWLRKLLRAARSCEVQPGPGYRILHKGAAGTILEISDRGGSGESAIQMFRIVSHAGDYLTCHTWDGTTEGEDSILVAKHYKLRFSITKEVLNDITHTYSNFDTAAQSRDATNGTDSYTQYITPMYQYGDPLAEPPIPPDTIFAARVAHTGVVVSDVELTWLELNDGRAWAKEDEAPA